MPEKTQVAMTTRERFLQMAQEEMTKFERQERESRKSELSDRAALLHIPLSELH